MKRTKINKTVSMLLSCAMVAGSLFALPFSASASGAVGGGGSASSTYSYIAEEDFTDGDTTGWISETKYGAKAATISVEEEGDNKFLRYTRTSTESCWYGEPLHDLSFSPVEKASLFGGKNVVIEYKVRASVASPANTYSLRMNNIDRGDVDKPANAWGKYTLMMFGNTSSYAINPAFYGANGTATSAAVSTVTMTGVAKDTWVTYKIEIDVDNNTVKYYANGTLADTTQYHSTFWKMSAVNTLNFCMVGGTGTVGDYFDVDDVKIYYYNPAPVATVLKSSSVTDEIVIQFDREIDESTLTEDAIKLLNGNGHNHATDEWYDAKSRQYHIKLSGDKKGTEPLAGANYVSIAGANKNGSHSTTSTGIYAKNLPEYKNDGLYEGLSAYFTLAESTGVSHDASLKDLTFNGYSVPNFAPDTYEYEVEMPWAETLELPSIVPTVNTSGATTSVTYVPTSQSWTGQGVNITVTAPDTYTKKTYRLRVNICGRSVNDAVLNTVEVSASPASVEIPAAGTAGTTLSTIVKDTSAADVTATAGTVAYSVVGNPDGISVNNEGVVTVTGDAMPGTYTVEAIVTPSASYPYQSRIGGRTTFTVTGTPKSRVYFLKKSDNTETDELITGENGYVYGAAKVYHEKGEATNYTMVTALYKDDAVSVIRIDDFDVQSGVLTEIKHNPDNQWLGLVPDDTGFSIKCIVYETATLKPVGKCALISQ